MEADDREYAEIALSQIMRLNASIYGLVFGILMGLALFLATNWLVVKGGSVIGPHLSLLGQYFPGYRVTFLGSLIGFGYAFALGYAAAYFTARLYNWILDARADVDSG